MKNRLIILSICMITVMTGCSGRDKNTFRKLENNETLTYKSEVISEEPHREITHIYKKRGPRITEIYHINGHALEVYTNNISDKNKWMYIENNSYKDQYNKEAIELWYIDGIKGKAEKLLSSINFVYFPDDTGNFFLIEDMNVENEYNMPVITIYKTNPLKKIIEKKYNKLSETSVVARNISYKNGFFYFKFKDDEHYSKEKIDINDFL